jgi:CBS domain-containing protein
MQPEVPAVPPDLTVRDWIERHALAGGRRGFLVSDGGSALGLVTVQDASRLPRERWDAARVAEIMTPVERLQTVTPGTPVLEVLRLMQAGGYNQVPVAVDGEIRGWIDRARLLEIVQLRAEFGR